MKVREFQGILREKKVFITNWEAMQNLLKEQISTD